ncbi:Protein phosphatase PP2A regulatory subunit B [Orbilia ellipsospora]|uniref:aminodeoxychorismate synthase n=1 Tax=Orbilia ellipsospora TaxID=2528407 RepID=A0AAV9XI80_9PEZI
MSQPPRRILLLDAYDSFSNNLAALLRHTTHAQIHTTKIDTHTLPSLLPLLPSFDAIVIGPGPGTPTNPQDVGIIPYIYSLAAEHVIPVFGVCLGFQSLCLAFGGKISRLPVVKHGQSSVINHTGTDIFRDCGSVDAIRYHSLRAELDEVALRQLEVLATADDGEGENGEVIMAVRHRVLPFWGVQYHPESCCTNLDGARVVENWWALAVEWLVLNKRPASVEIPEEGWKVPLQQRSLQGSATMDTAEKVAELQVEYNVFHAPCLSIVELCELLEVKTRDEFVMLDSSAGHTGQYTIIGVFADHLTETITWRIEEEVVSFQIHGYEKGNARAKREVSLKGVEGGVWGAIAGYMKKKKAKGGDEECPFWGGFMGYFNYESGVMGLGVDVKKPRPGDGAVRRPDISLTFFERSIVVDNVSGKVWVQSIHGGDEDWVGDMSEKVKLLAAMSITPTTTPPNGTISGSNSIVSQQRSNTANGRKLPISTEPVFPSDMLNIKRPLQEPYMENVRRCQHELARGESYELCLTAQTTVDIHHPFTDNQQEKVDSAWKIYKHLRKRNPAPFAGIYKCSTTCLLSSSPERFLSWDRKGKFQLRPIKGTVRKAKADGSTVSRIEAEAVLNTPKERAENLMIVDLIRHDLHGVLDGQEDEDGGVKVTKLMAVEEYETVFQLVSVIEGTMGERMRGELGFTGLDVLQRSLPPGSMTGAPKKRSVEILQEIEGDANAGGLGGERAMYSGVMGYWCASGSGDWSVVIRSMYRFDNEMEGVNERRRVEGEGKVERWRIGAGGAVTALSDPEGEWEEMLTKLNSTLAVFL